MCLYNFESKCVYFSDGLSKRRRQKKAKQKLEDIQRGCKRKLEQEYQVEVEENKNTDEALYEKMMSDLVEKFNHPNTSYAMKLQILTLSPFGIERTVRKFNASHRMVRRAKQLKSTSGILSKPGMKKAGNAIAPEVKDAVKEFYERDEISRIMPGMNDVISVRDQNGKRQPKRKRLILGNLKEIFKTYKDQTANPVGFSIFASLRPKWCILAGAAGTHSVCVCVKHQNPKLMLAALDKTLSIDDVIELAVCDISKEECMLGRCQQCPGIDQLKNFLQERTDQDADEIEYLQWVTTDRADLLKVQQPVDDFVIKLAECIKELTRHHHIAKSQTNFLRNLKTQLQREECVIACDFSENFSIIIQDAIQGYHLTSSQVTLHPFHVHYLNEQNNLANESFCVISDCLRHNATAVHAFQEKIIHILQSEKPHLRSVHYFTDGAPAQYKNKYMFKNICLHAKDFGLKCTWHYFATCHGKGPCDGIGGTIKRLTARASLQRTAQDQILNAQDVYKFCIASIPGENSLS